MPKLIIDGKEIEVAAGTTIIQAAEKLGIDIPRYCYHPALPVSGNCRICMVEVEQENGDPWFDIGCNMPVTAGMRVRIADKQQATRAHQSRSAPRGRSPRTNNAENR